MREARSAISKGPQHFQDAVVAYSTVINLRTGNISAYNVLWVTLCLWYFFWSLFAVINNVFMTFSFMDNLF